MRTIKVDKDELLILVKEGKTTREIGEIVGATNSYISYLIKKFGYGEYLKYKRPDVKKDYFSKIDTKEKAYILGFILADGGFSKKSGLTIQIARQDREILDFISSELGVKVWQDDLLDKKRKIFPHVRSTVKLPQITKDLFMLFGGERKEERRIPIIKKELEPYLVLGFFDGDGCITWGRRKDRNRVWQKISFTSSLSLLQGIQSILLKQDIATKIYPKTGANCYVMDTANPKTVLKILDYLYRDLVVLNRKYKKAQALRLELGEFGES